VLYLFFYLISVVFRTLCYLEISFPYFAQSLAVLAFAATCLAFLACSMSFLEIFKKLCWID